MEWHSGLVRRASRGSAQRSQIDIGKCCARKKFRPTVESGFVSVSLSNARDECRGGKSSGASDVPLGSRVRLPNSAARHLAGNVPGEAEVGEPSDLSHVKRESRGMKRSRRCGLPHRVSAGT